MKDMDTGGGWISSIVLGKTLGALLTISEQSMLSTRRSPNDWLSNNVQVENRAVLFISIACRLEVTHNL